jgi:Arc/MetJ family transcription regulator
MVRTRIEIDDALIAEAMRLSGARTKHEAVDIALRRLVDNATLSRAALRLRGKLAWDGDVDAWRSTRTSRGMRR